MTMVPSASDIQLAVVGSIAIDTIETPTARREEILGGSASFACAAASFFARTGLVGIVGTDFPAAFRALYERRGIDLRGLQSVAGRTFRWSGVYEADFINRRTLATELNVFETFAPELPEAYRSAPYVLLGNIAPCLQWNVLEQTRKARFVAVDTMDLWIRIARPELERVLQRADLLTLNDAEARELTGEHNLVRAARALLQRGPRHVVIKKGEHGAMLFSGDEIALVPAYPLDAFEDPTGAGDAFIGGFMGSLAGMGETTGPAIRAALLAGATVASFAVESFSLDGLDRLDRATIEARRLALCGMAGC
jgi:cytidine kinase